MRDLRKFCLVLCAAAIACSDKPPEDTATTTATTSASGSSSGDTTTTPTTGTPTTTPTTGGTTGGSGSATGSESSGTTGPVVETSTTVAPSTGETGGSSESGASSSSSGGSSDTGVMLACDNDGMSNLDGVCIVFLPQETAFTVGEAQAGVEFKYAVVVTGDVADVVPMTDNTCDKPGASGLYVNERVQGNDQNYCVCDQGKCPPPNDPAFVLKAGEYPDSLEWDGVNWNGPSDFNQPKGPPFPPGMYTVKLRAAGTHQGQAFEVTAELPITLTP